MPSILNVITTILSKNPAHTFYVENWLLKYGKVPLLQVDSVFTNLYNWYYYFVNEKGYPMPTFSKSGASADTNRLKNDIAGSSGVSGEIVYQFLAALYTGYSQGKLSKEFAFPRGSSTTTQTALDQGGQRTVVNFVPEQWKQAGIKIGVVSIVPMLMLAAGAIGGIYIAAKVRK